MENNTFTKTQARQLGQDVMGELEEFAKARGYTIAYKGGQIDGGRFTMRLQVDAIGTDHYAEQYLAYADRFGLPTDWLGREFTWSGKSYKLVGLKPSVRNPVLCDHGGAQYRFPVELIEALLKAQG
jgi:hypothetical protein